MGYLQKNKLIVFVSRLAIFSEIVKKKKRKKKEDKYSYNIR